MNREERQLKRHFGQLACEWCGRWANLWMGTPMNEKTLARWKDNYFGKLFYCKRERCIKGRIEGWESIKVKKQA